MNNTRFEIAKEQAALRGPGKGIGTLSEKTVHAVLKRYFEPDASKHEIRIGPYIADIVGEGGIIEIQTGAFNQIRDKLAVFLSVARVTLVYPIPRTRWLIRIDPDSGSLSPKRKSPVRGSQFDAFFELYRIKNLLTHKNLRIRLVLLDIEEYRFPESPSGKRNRRGYTRIDRVPVSLVDEICLDGSADYMKLIPQPLAERFTTRDYAAEARIALRYAQTALNVLTHVGATRKTGKRGRLSEYERVMPQTPYE